MDTVALVDLQIEDGATFLAHLAAAGVAIEAACWVKPSDEDRWSLYLATPLVDEKGSTEGYRVVYPLLRSLGPLEVSDSRVRLVGARHPMVADSARLLHRYRGRPV